MTEGIRKTAENGGSAIGVACATERPAAGSTMAGDGEAASGKPCGPGDRVHDKTGLNTSTLLTRGCAFKSETMEKRTFTLGLVRSGTFELPNAGIEIPLM